MALNLSRQERVDLIEWNRESLPLSTQAELLGLNRSGLYYKPTSPSPMTVALRHKIDEIYTQRPFLGSRRITWELKREGFPVNRKAVQRHMQEMGIRAIYPGPNLSKREQESRIFPYLLRNLKIEKPNHVWGIDITYIRLSGGWMYLAALIDWFSRYIVEWELDQTLETGLVLKPVKRALDKVRPEIFNSDQGSQFTSDDYIELLQNADVKISMDGKGRAIDNIFTERFWRSLKYEEVYLKDYESPREARRGIAGYIEYYNFDRPHMSLGYEIPGEVYVLN